MKKIEFEILNKIGFSEVPARIKIRVKSDKIDKIIYKLLQNDRKITKEEQYAIDLGIPYNKEDLHKYNFRTLLVILKALHYNINIDNTSYLNGRREILPLFELDDYNSKKKILYLHTNHLPMGMISKEMLDFLTK